MEFDARSFYIHCSQSERPARKCTQSERASGEQAKKMVDEEFSHFLRVDLNELF
jgi:hypothetical protein